MDQMLVHVSRYNLLVYERFLSAITALLPPNGRPVYSGIHGRDSPA